MALAIHQATVRKSLKPRRAPYWGGPIIEGLHLGVRALEDGSRTWQWRYYDGSTVHGPYALGLVADDFDHSAAVKAALAAYQLRFVIEVSTEGVTVTTVCKEYVEDRRREKGESTAYDAEVRFKRSVYDKPLGALLLTRERAAGKKLTTEALKKWRSDLPGSKSHQDREFRSLKAALNLAVLNRRCDPALAIEWRAVKPYGADKNRTLYLGVAQRRALLDACDGPVRDLVEAAIHTGARPGELVKLKREHWDSRTKALAIPGGKTGERQVGINDGGAEFFNRVAKDKLPKAPLLVDESGEPWKFPAQWQRPIAEAAKRAELPAGTSLYTLRHSWITQALIEGLPTLHVARLTGTSLPMIEKNYGQHVKGAAREALAKVQFL